MQTSTEVSVRFRSHLCIVAAMSLLLGVWGCWWGYPFRLHPDTHIVVEDAWRIATTGQTVVSGYMYGWLPRLLYAGAMALAVPVSSWMFITTLCLALYLAAVKRRQELSQRGADGREVLVEPLGAPEALVICGAGHVARALAPVARGVGFDVTVIDEAHKLADYARSTIGVEFTLPQVHKAIALADGHASPSELQTAENAAMQLEWAITDYLRDKDGSEIAIHASDTFTAGATLASALVDLAEDDFSFSI